MGATEVSLDEVDLFLESSEPLPVIESAPVGQIDQKIASHIVELVDDGATLQLGIGSIPNAVGQQLIGKKDLGIHTEMINDAILELYNHGFVTGRKKSLSKVVEKLNVKPFIKKSLKEVFYDDNKVTADLVNRYNDFMRLKGNREAFFQKVNTLKQSKESDLQKIDCPTLIQWGKQDNWIPLELADIFTANLVDHELIVYDKCGHVPQEELPEQSVKDVIEFLNRD